MIFGNYFPFKKHIFISSWLIVQFLLTTSMYTQSTIDHLEISLLTCKSGDALYTTFGHTALRVIDHSQQKDLVFDYGNFDFNTPFFTIKFLRGSLDYHLSATRFSDFKRWYTKANRGVIEQRLNLKLSSKQKIYQQLINNLKPTNRYYKYDFLKDNCTTRIRDIISQYAALQPTNLSSKSYRVYLKEYLTTKKWLALGINILLGSPVDQPVNNKEAIFLPKGLSEALGNYQLVDTTQSILGAKKVIVQSTEAKFTNWAFFQPIYSLSILLLLFIFLIKFRLISTKFIHFIYVLFGLGGLLLLFLWFGTRHDATQMNFNLLWLNPVYLLIPFLKTSSFQKVFLKIIFLINCSLLLFWVIIPQSLNPAILALIGMMLMVISKEIGIR